MGSNLSVQHVLDILSPTFRTVDVRTLSFSVDSADYNLVTVVGFEERTPHEVQHSLDELVRTHSKFGDSRLNFHFKVESADSWSELDGELRSGALSFGHNRVGLMRPVEIAGLKGYINSINFLRRRQDWPVFEAHGSWNPNQQEPSQTVLAQKLRWVQQDEDLIRHLNANGYRSLKDIFRVFLDARQDSDPGSSSDIYVAVPVFAAIRGFRCSPTENRLYVAYDCDIHLQPRVHVYGEHRIGHNETERIQFSSADCAPESGCIASGPLIITDRTTVVNVWLGHSDLGHLTERSATPRELFPPEEINPLWHLLQLFCPSEKVQELLTQPPRPHDKRPKEQRYFEQHVGWLLSVHGFSVVILGEFESLRAAGSFVEQGSLDILAFHRKRNRVLLASCTIAPPEERDYGNLVNIRGHLLGRINRDVSFRTEMAIFSTAAECVPPPQYSGGSTYVAVFDASDLRRAIANLNAARDDDFFELLEGTQHGLDIGTMMPTR